MSFAPDARTPGPGQVFLDLAGSVGQNATLAVRVRDASGIAGARLRVSYDPYRVVFQGWAPGTLLESGGAQAAYVLGEQQPGLLVVVATRMPPSGGSPGADAGADAPVLVVLRFAVVRLGIAPVGLPGDELTDSTGSAVSGISFFGGALTGS